ncbi:MAG: polysaccharide deacetylase family protein [Actinobacteria bacterium]|nr:polysaccharide deacetylase family protein [Actinomycetota bacterium]
MTPDKTSDSSDDTPDVIAGNEARISSGRASLETRLGYAPGTKLLLINCDDLGSCHSSNLAIYECLREGIATSATLMVPCPWSREAAAMYKGEDVGVHLTLNSEFDLCRWGPITYAPSLLDGDGGFPRTVVDVWDHADLDEVRKECHAQIERAILWGFDVSHLDAHMGTMQIKAEFFDVYLDLAVEFHLPLRLSGSETEQLIGFPFRTLADEAGVIYPDNFLFIPGVGTRQYLMDAIPQLQPGVTEAYLHPAIDSSELRAFAPDWKARVDDYELLTHDPQIREELDRHTVQLIGYRALKELMH